MRPKPSSGFAEEDRAGSDKSAAAAGQPCSAADSPRAEASRIAVLMGLPLVDVNLPCEVLHPYPSPDAPIWPGAGASVPRRRDENVHVRTFSQTDGTASHAAGRGPVPPMSVRGAPLRAAPTTPTTPTNQRLTPLLLVGLMLGLLMAELDQTMFSTALPTIVGELGGLDRMLWVTTAYVLAATVVMPVYGKLGDLLGRKPLFIAALSVLVAGCVLGGLAPT